ERGRAEQESRGNHAQEGLCSRVRRRGAGRHSGDSLMADDEKIVPITPHRHGQPGYSALAGLPQRLSIADPAISTGWWELDQIFKLSPGQFVVCTGVAGHGKSTFLFNVLCNIARKNDIRSCLYVPEN